MGKNWLKEYFSFTKKERTGIVSLLVILVFVWFLPDILPKKNDFDAATFEAIQKKALAFLKSDSEINAEKIDSGVSVSSANHLTGSLFYFDPNTISTIEWRKLGVPEKTIHIIQNYRTKGGKFKNPEDLSKIYGLPPSLCERLLPFVRIVAARSASNDTLSKWPRRTFFPPSYAERKPAKKFDLEINTADTTEWIALPGIGSRLAARIVGFRDKLGGFHNVMQVAETYGLMDSVFQAVKSYLHCDSSHIRQMDLNRVSLLDLKAHPYFRNGMANTIYQYRLQHGNFNSLEELKKITIVTEEIFTKISPYLTVR